MKELEVAAEREVLTTIQFEILKWKLRRITHQYLVQNFNLSGNTALGHCIARTAAGRLWYPGYPGGGDPYLSDVDRIIFADIIDDASDFANCISSPIAVQLAHHLARSRAKKARALLAQAGCWELRSKVEESKQPCKSWLSSFTETLNMKIVPARELEAIRRSSCDRTLIRAFF